MKIAYCCNSYFSYSETFIRDLVEGLAAKGDNVYVFSQYKTEITCPIERVSVIEIGLKPQPSLIDRALERLSVKSFNERNAERYKKTVYPKIRSLKPDVIYCDYGTNGVFLQDLALELNVPLVVHFHGFDASSAFRDTWYLKQVEKLMKGGHRIITPSNHIKHLLKIATGGDVKISVIPCLPDLSKLTFYVRNESKYPTVVAIGRLTGKKNPLALIEAFNLVLKNIPDARLDIVGEGPELERVEKRISDYGLEKSVTLNGALQHDNALEVMSSSWVFVQHSVTSLHGDQEGLPVSIMEALAMQIPVVSTIHSGIPEIVIDSENGFLVQEHNYHMMAQKIIILLNDCEMRKSFGKNGQQKIRNMFREENRVDKIYNLIHCYEKNKYDVVE